MTVSYNFYNFPIISSNVPIISPNKWIVFQIRLIGIYNIL